jgi:hypothetical protein
MPAKKSARIATQRSLPAVEPEPTATSASSTGRKPWIKKTPVEVVLGEIGKQEKKVADMRENLAREERELAKLNQARKVLEAE